ncbi:MAG: nucleotidyltransferase domain-containing protein [DPANN group archaeon]|nr:nucleotidyltransferase domain-containing protein [DPANN group archaeon]
MRNFITTKDVVRRIFGKKEIDIMRRQLEGLPLSQSEQNRISRDIKPKLRAIKGLSAFSDEFGLGKDQDNRRLIKRAVEEILRDELQGRIQAILLFGSFADKSRTRRSDIDICVVFKKALSLAEMTKFRIRMGGKLPEKIDVQVFRALPQRIRRSIARNHRVLYKDNSFSNLDFTNRHLKDEDYFIRIRNIFGAET